MWCHDIGVKGRGRFAAIPAGWSRHLVIPIGLVVVFVSSLLESTPAKGAKFTITPSASLGLRYNDNIYFNDSDKTKDFSTVVSPGIQFKQSAERGEINVNGKVYSFTYAENSELNSIDSEISADGQYALSRVVKANASVVYKEDNQQDRDLTTSGIVSTNSKRVQNNESIGLMWARSEKTSIGASLFLGNTEYEDEDYSDYSSHGFNLNINTNISRYISETTGILSLSRNRYEYDVTNSTVTSASIGFEKSLSEKYSISSWLGPSLVQTEYKDFRSENSDEWGAMAHFSLKGNLKNSSLNISITHQVDPGSFSNSTVNKTSLEFDYLKELSVDLSAGINTSYFHNKSSDSVNENLLENIDENAFNISPHLFYKFNNDLGLDVMYRLSHIEDNNNGNQKMQNSIFMQFVWKYELEESELSYFL